MYGHKRMKLRYTDSFMNQGMSLFSKNFFSDFFSCKKFDPSMSYVR